MSQTSHTIYASPTEQWHQDSDGRIWFLDLETEEQVELVSGNVPFCSPLPDSVYVAFGKLAARVALGRSSKLEAKK